MYDRVLEEVHRMICRDCRKQLKGGFKVKDSEDFQCGDCSIHEVELNNLKSTLIQVIKHSDELINTEVEGQKYKKLSEDLKQGILEISSLMNYCLSKNSVFNNRSDK